VLHLHQDRCKSTKRKAIEDGVFLGRAIVPGPPSALGESPVLVQGTRRVVGLAYLEEDSLRSASSRQIEEFRQELRPKTPAASPIYNRYILDFPLGAHRACNQEPEELTFLNHQHDSGWFRTLEHAFIVLSRPVGSGLRLSLQRKQSR